MYGECRRCRPEYQDASFSHDYVPDLHRTSKYGGSSAFGYVELKDASGEMLPAGHFSKLPK